jgi:hypothetical protein
MVKELTTDEDLYSTIGSETYEKIMRHLADNAMSDILKKVIDPTQGVVAGLFPVIDTSGASVDIWIEANWRVLGIVFDIGVHKAVIGPADEIACDDVLDRYLLLKEHIGKEGVKGRFTRKS